MENFLALKLDFPAEKKHNLIQFSFNPIIRKRTEGFHYDISLNSFFVVSEFTKLSKTKFNERKLQKKPRAFIRNYTFLLIIEAQFFDDLGILFLIKKC